MVSRILPSLGMLATEPLRAALIHNLRWRIWFSRLRWHRKFATRASPTTPLSNHQSTRVIVDRSSSPEGYLTVGGWVGAMTKTLWFFPAYNYAQSNSLGAGLHYGPGSRPRAM